MVRLVPRLSLLLDLGRGTRSWRERALRAVDGSTHSARGGGDRAVGPLEVASRSLVARRGLHSTSVRADAAARRKLARERCREGRAVALQEAHDAYLADAAKQVRVHG